MNFQDELFPGMTAYEKEYDIHPDVIFVRYDVWFGMFHLHPIALPNCINVHGTQYVRLPRISEFIGGPMFHFSDRDFLNAALRQCDPHQTRLDRVEFDVRPLGRIADWNPNYATAITTPVERKTRSISVALLKVWHGVN